MGCNETKDSTAPTLLCFCEQNNEEQKQYCVKLINNFKHEKTIKYELKSVPQVPFSIGIRIKGTTSVVQNVFDNSDQTMNETLQKIYNLLQ